MWRDLPKKGWDCSTVMKNPLQFCGTAAQGPLKVWAMLLRKLWCYSKVHTLAVLEGCTPGQVEVLAGPLRKIWDCSAELSRETPMYSSSWRRLLTASCRLS